MRRTKQESNGVAVNKQPREYFVSTSTSKDASCFTCGTVSDLFLAYSVFPTSARAIVVLAENNIVR